jgi:hypothetical protein
MPDQPSTVRAGPQSVSYGFHLIRSVIIAENSLRHLDSIARSAVPLALFGPVRYTVLFGRLARPGLITQALAPSLGALALTHGGPDLAYGLLLMLALANVGLAVALLRLR